MLLKHFTWWRKIEIDPLKFVKIFFRMK